MKSPKSTTKGVIYCRTAVNDIESKKKLGAQEKVCRKYCAEHGIDVVRIFKDMGASGNDIYRTGLIDAIQYCRKNKTPIVVTEISRLSRDSKVFINIKQTLAKIGVEILIPTTQTGLAPDPVFFETLRGLFADHEHRAMSACNQSGTCS